VGAQLKAERTLQPIENNLVTTNLVELVSSDSL